jgi:diguanylate cyclase (GGDEF)-like protein/PAS domain S-box-containing protein
MGGAVRRPRVWLVLLVAAFAVWTPGGLPGSVIADDVGLALVAGWAARQWVRRARHTGSLSSWLMAAACGCWFIGEATWGLIEVGFGREPGSPSWADVGYLGAIPLAVGALSVLPAVGRRAVGRGRALADSVSVAAAVLFASWALVLGPMFDGAGGSWAAKVVGLAYPVGDVVVVSLVVIVLARRVSPSPRLLLAATGLAAISLADSGYAWLTLHSAYESGNVLDTGWFVGYLLLGLAATAHDVSAGDDVDQPPSKVALALPYVPLGVALLVGVSLAMAGESADFVLIGDGVVLLVAVMARQWFALAENASLARDLEDRVRERTAELALREERFRSLVQHASDVVTVIDDDAIITYQSESAMRVLGQPAIASFGRALSGHIHPDDRPVLGAAIADVRRRARGTTSRELRWRHGDGGWRTTETKISNLLDVPAVAGIMLTTRDITDQSQLECELRDLALHDALTGLANRTLFNDRVAHAIDQFGRATTDAAVVLIDLDDFKSINDTFGHHSGDLVLSTVARRLETAVRTKDTVARLGGDEFAILAEDLESVDDASVLAQRALDSLAEPLRVGDRPLRLRASAGVVVLNDPMQRVDDVLRAADIAMYAAKADRNGTFRQFDEAMNDDAVAQAAFAAEFATAIATGQLVVHYQPTVDVDTGAVVGAEALVRWDHPTRGLLPPDRFIPLAEASGQVIDVGAFVLEAACTQAARWNADIPGFALGVNVSPRQLHLHGFVDDVATVLDRTGFPATQLTLEITESLAIDGSDATLATLRALRALGVRLAIDDFGTGYSSLAYLADFPVDALKIDRAFVHHSRDNDRQHDLVATIVNLAESFALDSIAEGVETEEQRALLRQLGCRLAQGYLFSPPVPPSAFEHLMASALV